MAVFSGPEITNSGLVFYYDMNNTQKSWKGKPATNLIVTTPISLGVYAYASGPVNTSVIDSNNQPRTVRRYTITSAVNTARANILPSGLTTGVDYAFSFIIKYNGGNVATPTLYSDSSKGNPEGGSNNNTFNTNSVVTTPLGNNWYQVKHVFNYSTCPTGACTLAYGITTGTDSTYVNQTFDVYNEQFEISSFATPFVDGTRTNTQALLDLTKTNTITANTLTYASNNTFTFNGTSDFIDSGYDMSWSNTNSATISMFLRPDSLTTGRPFIGKTDYEWQMNQVNQSLEFVYWNTTGGHTNGPIITVGNFFTSTSTYVHLALVWNHVDNNIYIYRNGTLVNTSAWVNASINRNIAETIKIGGNVYAWGMGGSYWPGKIDVVSMYTKALSAAEVTQNFEALRGRYGV